MLQAIKGHIIEARRFGELTITEHGYLVFEDGLIRGVFAALPEEYRNAQVTDEGDRLVLQGFCDMHLHAPQFPMIGMGMDLPLLTWLQTYAFPTEKRFSDLDFARSTYRRLARALADNGTTRICAFSSRHAEATLILMEELEKAGISGYVGKVNMDRNSGVCEESTAQSRAETLRWLDESDRFSRIRPILTPRFTPACTDETMAFLGALAKERGLYVQSHLSENRDEIAWVKRLHPDCAQYWETYEKFGLFGDRTIMAHCVYSDEREQAAMRKNNVLSVHCADSNVGICSGFAPVRRMIENGVWVALGSDVAGGAQLSMLQVMTASIRASKARTIISGGDEAFLTVAEAYYLATSAGARYFGDDPGFAVGAKLNAVVIDDAALPEAAKALSVRERFERAVYLTNESDVTSVYGEGRRIK